LWIRSLLYLPQTMRTGLMPRMGGTSTHQFTIQSAYRLQHRDIHALEGDWKSLWDWKWPHRIQTFIWLVAQKRILTNFRRSKWRVGISPLCTRCGRDDEITIHVLCECVYATQVWLRLVPSNFITDFFTFDCRNWIFNNISKQGIGGHSTNWKITFMTTCWFMWAWRNKAIFEKNFQQLNNPVLVIQNFAQKIDLCSNQRLHCNFQMKETIYIGWKNPPLKVGLNSIVMVLAKEMENIQVVVTSFVTLNGYG